MSYSEFQNQPSSEKIVLAILEASKRLMGWEVHAGSVYKITGFTHAVIVSLEDYGTAYASVGSIGALTASTYYLDRTNQILYVNATASANPNSRILVVTFRLFFANVPIALPYDLTSGFEVFWEPLVNGTSEFGVEIDTVAQVSEAIEGSGSLTLQNDFDFWPDNFDKLSFENQRCLLYSYNRSLDVSEARLMFKGRVERKTYNKETISFQLKDQFSELRAPVTLATIASLGARTGNDLAKAKQRMILGRVFGNVPTNIDQVLTGYPLTGTISISVGTTAVTGTGTLFRSELSPGDRIVILGGSFTVGSIATDTSLELSQAFVATSNAVTQPATVVPDQPKRFINRVFKIAGHALRQPTMLTETGSNISVLYVDDATDVYSGDVIYVGALGSGEIATVSAVYGNRFIQLSTSLATVPPVGTTIHRPAVQNVRLDDIELVYERDYAVNPTTAVLTLTDNAEANASPVYQHVANMSFTNGSRTVTGTGFQGVIYPSFMVGLVDNADFFEVMAVDSDTQLTLRTPATFTDNDTGRFQSYVYEHGTNVLSCDVLGRTGDGTSSGVLLKTAPQITKALLEDAGLTVDIDATSFEEAEAIAYQHIGITVPASYSESTSPAYREIINKVNKSVFGSLVQNSSFQFGYQVLQPNKPTTATKFSEADLLSFSLQSLADNAVKTIFLEYQRKEYDYEVQESQIDTVETTNDNANYVMKTDRTNTVTTYLVDATDAQIMSDRWSFLLSTATGRLTFTTKLQGQALEVGDIIEIEHRKFYKRYGGTGSRKLLLVESVKRNGETVKIEATDLSNTFNRVAVINGYTNEYADATETEKVYGGYISDQYGLIDNDAESFETNLIW